ncbi:DUF3558 domain-containing protein [Streptomyces sp. ME19-01-6]|uniref:DUF3558 domain-containing protein n=1 Tax=Streptomyces sp. ME19-01-6 TaxID=3028686 RepID=UPI0029BA6B87|nr:DUF3558 domain-containing protein [Streptomyces sp. ME19-01-6]MDX3226646.1 DUF3558 domain-containing protein [Streptomyces sp. ME19-01-6]
MQPAQQRRAYVPGAARAAAVLATVLAAIGLSGCTSTASHTGLDDGKPGDSGAPAAAAPGKYRTLPEACGAVDAKTLRQLLPGADEDDPVYDGQATVTYDTNRRVGCRWKLETGSGTRYLTLDFERVVSYDPTVSDDDQAKERYEKKATAAHVPGASDTPSAPSGSGSGSSDEDTPKGSASASSDSGKDDAGKNGSGNDSSGKDASKTNGAKVEGATPDASGTEEPGTDASGGDSDTSKTAAPRRLDDLADDAFLDDQLITSDSGIHRDVTVVFRSSNVIATIEYDQWSTNKKHIPSSEELQVNAEDLAQELTGRLNE